MLRTPVEVATGALLQVRLALDGDEAVGKDRDGVAALDHLLQRLGGARVASEGRPEPAALTPGKLVTVVFIDDLLLGVHGAIRALLLLDNGNLLPLVVGLGESGHCLHVDLLVAVERPGVDGEHRGHVLWVHDAGEEASWHLRKLFGILRALLASISLIIVFCVLGLVRILMQVVMEI